MQSRAFGLLLLLIIGCENFGVAYPTTMPVVTVTELGEIPKGSYVTARDGGHSFIYDGEAVYTFGDTVLSRNNSENTNWVVNTMYHTPDRNPDNGIGGGYNFRMAGQPANMWMPYTAAEIAYNESKAGIVGLWPLSSFRNPETGKQYLWFAKVLEHPGAWWDNVGTGFVEVTSLTTHCLRLQHRSGHAEDHVMFTERNYGDICVVWEGHVYAYALAGIAELFLARAPLDQEGFLDRAQWTFWNGSQWVSTPSAKVVASNATAGTIQWNSFFNCWLYVHMQFLGSNMVAQVADSLWGPWSSPRILFAAQKSPGGKVPYYAQTHPMFEKNSGRTLYTSYCIPPDSGFTGARIVFSRVHFGGPAGAAQEIWSLFE